MVQILPKVQSFGEKFAQALGGAAGDVGEGYFQGKSKQAQKDKAEKGLVDLFGPEKGKSIANMPEEIQKVYIAQELKNKGKEDFLNKQMQQINETFGPGKKSFSDELINDATDSGSMNPEVENKEFDFSKIPPVDVLKGEALGLKGIGDLRDSAIKSKESDNKEKRRSFESDRDYHAKTADPILKEASEIIKEAPIKRALNQQLRRDIATGNTSGMMPFMVDSMGLEAFRNPESARFKNVIKQKFVETVHSLGSGGARMNQFLERTLADAQPKIGRDEESNMTVVDLDSFVDDMKEKRARLQLELAQEDMKEHGYARNDIGMRADKLMDKYAEQRQDEMAYDIRKRHEAKMSDEQLTREIVSKSVPPDTPLTVRVARILMVKNNDNEKEAQAEAKRLGFKIPTDETYKRKQ